MTKAMAGEGRERGARWYDGRLYAWFFDPLDRSHKQAIASLVPPGASVLEVACGTGALSLLMAEKASRVLGLDASKPMLARARAAARQGGAENISFVLADAKSLSRELSEPFDYAVFSLFFHEVEEEVRLAALDGAARLSSRLILSDYSSPQPKSPLGFVNIAVERLLGGRDNFRLFLDFQKKGGLQGLAKKLALPVERFFRDSSGTREFLLARGRGE